jgi:hypothetical protein
MQSSVPRLGLTPVELAGDLLSRIDEGNAYARLRKQRFRWRSAAVRVASLVLSGVSTVILGLQNLDFWTGLGFSLVAVATVVNALEPFFAWRARWVLMEETQYRFLRLRDDLTYYLASTRPEDVQQPRIAAMYEQYQQIWDLIGQRWLDSRRTAGPGQ